MIARTTPMRLEGGPFQRGQAQARDADAGQVGAVIATRLDAARALLAGPAASAFLIAQRRFMETHCRDDLEEVAGIAEGFQLDLGQVIAFLHLGILGDLASSSTGEADGCSVWALGSHSGGARLGKNRDFHGEQAGMQRLFLHRDPAWGARQVLCVGSLGAPGAYSSGINSDGLAVADTQVATRDHGPGWLRYFVMSRLLRHHACVAQALEDLRRLRHAGGGSLVLADALGAVAAVDLGHGGVRVDPGHGARVARTNLYVAGGVAGTPDASPMRPSSEARLARLRALLAEDEVDEDALTALMASHDDGAGTTGLCRHGQDGDARTLSASVFDCGARRLRFATGNPCDGVWSSHGFSG
jgi:hypothetical protein